MFIPLDLPLDHDGRFDSMDRPANAQICMSVCFVLVLYGYHFNPFPGLKKVCTNTGRRAMAFLIGFLFPG